MWIFLSGPGRFADVDQFFARGWYRDEISIGTESAAEKVEQAFLLERWPWVLKTRDWLPNMMGGRGAGRRRRWVQRRKGGDSLVVSHAAKERDSRRQPWRTCCLSSRRASSVHVVW